MKVDIVILQVMTSYSLIVVTGTSKGPADSIFKVKANKVFAVALVVAKITSHEVIHCNVYGGTRGEL
jgi:hypothetical protein